MDIRFRVGLRRRELEVELSCRGLEGKMLHDLCVLHAKLKSMLHKLQQHNALREIGSE